MHDGAELAQRLCRYRPVMPYALERLRVYAADLEDIQTSQAKLWQSVRDLVLSLAKLK